MKKFHLGEGKYEIIKLSGGTELRVPLGVHVKDRPYHDTEQRLVEKCEAAWLVADENDVPMSFCLVGAPGVGKNALVYHISQRLEQELHVLMGHEDLSPEDLLVSATINKENKVDYTASPLVAAMLRGGICFIDEIAKMRPQSHAPLSSLLDDRRAVYSAVLGQWINASPQFRFCAAYNPTDEEAFSVSPWLQARLLPTFNVERPSLEVLERIAVQERRHDPLWARLADRVVERAVEADVEMDCGTMLRTVSYCYRLERQKLASLDSGVDLGDPIDIAFRHVVGYPAGEDAEEPDDYEVSLMTDHGDGD